MHRNFPENVAEVLLEHLDRSETGTAVLDAQDRFLYCNQAFVTMLGLEAFAPIGRTHDEFLEWMYRHRMADSQRQISLADWLAEVHAVFRSATFRSFEAELMGGKWVLVTQQLYHRDTVVTVCTDITDLKRTHLALHDALADLERLAMTDELTSLPNRRAFWVHAETELQRARRYSRPTTLAMVDLDHFKKINDQYGHAGGDLVLRHFAELLRNHIRGQDLCGRLGGEEFSLIFPETTAAAAIAVLERIRKALACADLDAIAPGFSYRFSAGVAELPPGAGISSDQWLHLADLALYRAKALGRDRTVSSRQLDDDVEE